MYQIYKENPVKIDDVYTMLVNNKCENPSTISRIIEARSHKQLKAVGGILFIMGIWVGHLITMAF